MHTPHRASLAWSVIAAGVVTYNLSTKDGELLSEQADRWIEKHPVAARLAVAVVAAHVANATPQMLDPIHWFFTTTRRLRAH